MVTECRCPNSRVSPLSPPYNRIIARRVRKIDIDLGKTVSMIATDARSLEISRTTPQGGLLEEPSYMDYSLETMLGNIHIWEDQRFLWIL